MWPGKHLLASKLSYLAGSHPIQPTPGQVAIIEAQKQSHSAEIEDYENIMSCRVASLELTPLRVTRMRKWLLAYRRDGSRLAVSCTAGAAHAAASCFPSVVPLHSRVASAAQCRFGHPEQMLCDETPGRYNAAPRPHIPVMRVWATVPAQNLESIDVTGTHTQTHNRGQKTWALNIPGALVVDARPSANGGGRRRCCVKSSLAATTYCPRRHI